MTKFSELFSHSSATLKDWQLSAGFSVKRFLILLLEVTLIKWHFPLTLKQRILFSITIDKKFEWIPDRKCIFFHWGADETISRYIAVLNHREGTRDDIDYFQRQAPTKCPETAPMIYQIFDAVKNSIIWKTPITIDVCYNTDSQQVENITIYR